MAAAAAIGLDLLPLRRLRRHVDYRDVGRSMALGRPWAVVRVFGGTVLLFGV